MAFQSVEDIFFVFGPFYDQVRQIGYSALAVFLTLAFIKEVLMGMEGRTSYASLFTRVLVIAGVLTIYTPIFQEITHGMELLANFFMPSEGFKEAIEKVFTAYKEDRDLGMIALFKMTFLEWIIQTSYGMAYWVMRAFSWIRLIFLSALYITGPIFLAVGVFLPNMASSWVRWVFEISTWNVVLSLFIRILVEMNFFEIYEIANTPALDLIAMNIVVILIIILFVPMFSGMMIRGAGGFSGPASAMLGMGGALMLKKMKDLLRSKDYYKPRMPSGNSNSGSYKGAS